ncbi:MAG: hypothetical protein ABIR32_14070 [Ilumatobacteraceae bacterium]
MSTTTNITAGRRHPHPNEFYPRSASSGSTTTALCELRSAIEHAPRKERRFVVARQTHPTVVSDVALGSLVWRFGGRIGTDPASRRSASLEHPGGDLGTYTPSGTHPETSAMR